MADFKVSVSIIEPSFFRTNLLQGDTIFNNLQNTIKNLPDTVREEFRQEYFDAGKRLKDLNLMFNEEIVSSSLSLYLKISTEKD